jgi:beta-lactam-binding protein with PASTA domain
MFSFMYFLVGQIAVEKEFTSRGLPVDSTATQRAALISGAIANPVGLLLAVRQGQEVAEATVVQAVQPTKVVVPYVFGKDLATASNEINSRGLVAVKGPATDVALDIRLREKVTTTEPPAGEPVTPKSNVTISTAGRVLVPYVFGKTLEEASKAITERGLLVLEGSPFDDPNGPDGVIFGTEPTADSPADLNTKVKILRGKRGGGGNS